MKKKIWIMTAGVLIACLIITAFGVWIKSYLNWKKGLYIYEGNIDIVCFENNVSFDIYGVAVGKEYFEKIKNHEIEVYLEDGSVLKKAEYQMVYYVENKHYYNVSLDISVDLSAGTYSFQKLSISAGEETIVQVKENILIEVLKPKATSAVSAQMVSFTRNALSCEMIYMIENTGEQTIEITDFAEFSGTNMPLSMMVVNNIDNDDESVDLNRGVPLKTPFEIEVGKKALVCVYFDLSEEDVNWYYYTPKITVNAGGNIYYIGMDNRCVSPMIEQTAEDILKYVRQ